MNNNVVFKISGGKTTFLVSEHTKAFMNKTASVKRASHVVPWHGTTRVWFKLLRKVFGEDGHVGNWTRTWKCDWEVNLHPVMGPYVGPFATRQDAIDFEIDWLNRNFLNV
jgi:hypothetical protein